MFKRWIAAILVIALAGTLWYVAFSTDDPDYSEELRQSAAETAALAGQTEEEPGCIS